MAKEPLTISIEPELREEIEYYARAHDRSLSYMISVWVEEGLGREKDQRCITCGDEACPNYGGIAEGEASCPSWEPVQ